MTPGTDHVVPSANTRTTTYPTPCPTTTVVKRMGAVEGGRGRGTTSCDIVLVMSCCFCCVVVSARRCVRDTVRYVCGFDVARESVSPHPIDDDTDGVATISDSERVPVSESDLEKLIFSRVKDSENVRGEIPGQK